MSYVIEDFAPVAKPNKYDEAVDALIQAGEGKALTIVVPRGTKRDGSPADGVKDRVLFQKAANAKGFTAKVVEENVVSDTEVSFKFTLTQKHNRGTRKPKVEAEAPAEVDATVETEAPAEVETATEDAPKPGRRR